MSIDNISRRSMIAGFATGVAVAVTPAVMATAPEDAATRVNRLLDELSTVLDGYLGGQFRGIVEPASKPGGMVWLQNMNAHTPSPEGKLDAAGKAIAIEYHARRLGELMHEKCGKPYLVGIKHDVDMIVCLPNDHGGKGLLVRHA